MRTYQHRVRRDVAKRVSFEDAEFSGGQVSFRDAEFYGGSASFYHAQFSGGEVDFHRAVFTDGHVDFSEVCDWSVPPAFPWTDTPPSGVKLPKEEEQSQT